MAKRRPWTMRELETLRQQYLAGEPVADIAAALGRTPPRDTARLGRQLGRTPDAVRKRRAVLRKREGDAS